MKTIYLEIENKQDKQYKKSDNTHFWYDVKDKKLISLYGGCLKFKYDIKEQKPIPYVEDIKIASYGTKNNSQDIILWAKKYSNIISINTEETTSKSIAISFEDKDEEQVLALVSRSQFRYS